VGRRGYPPEFRRKVLDSIEAGRPVIDVARDLGISAESIYTWRRQDRVDKGLAPGLTSADFGPPFQRVGPVWNGHAPPSAAAMGWTRPRVVCKVLRARPGPCR
jgi:hypothetical protein